MNNDYRAFSAYSRIDGAIVGVMWIISFFCFIGEFQEPLLGLVAIVLGVASVFVEGIRLRKFRDGVFGGYITFGRAMLYSIMVFFYASVLMAVAQYLYFQFIDHGYLINQYVAALSTPEYAKVANDVYHVDAKQLVTILQSGVAAMRPIEIAFQFLTVNVILSIIISLPVAALMRRVRG